MSLIRPAFNFCANLLKKLPTCRALHTSQVTTAPIKIGESLPTVPVFEDFPRNKVNLYDLSAGRKIALFAVPGAFSPACSKTHLPGFVQNANHLIEQGIDEIVCVAVNDPYVMSAWARQHKTKGKIRMLADPSGAFIKAMDLGFVLPSLGGYRARRFSMIVIDSSVQELNVEPDGTGLTCSLANRLQLDKVKNTEK